MKYSTIIAKNEKHVYLKDKRKFDRKENKNYFSNTSKRYTKDQGDETTPDQLTFDIRTE